MRVSPAFWRCIVYSVEWTDRRKHKHPEPHDAAQGVCRKIVNLVVDISYPLIICIRKDALYEGRWMELKNRGWGREITPF